MNAMTERPGVDRLRQAMRAANIEEIAHAADEIGQQAIAVALQQAEADPPADPPAQQPRRYEPTEEEERERLLDAALADAIETVSRQRNRLGRRVCSRPDGTITRKIFELLRSMAGADGGNDSDPSFQ
jgi:hypothetical protein